MTAAIRSLFLSPHLDDVAFSCGATAARCAQAGERPLVVTIFTADGDEDDLSDFARELHARVEEKTGVSAKALGQVRRAEDLAAMAELGVAHRWLGHADAIYRGYGSRQALFAAPQPEDAAFFERLVAEVVALWRETEGAVVYLPLGVGGHVDHRTTCALAAPLAEAGATVWHYEDFPYAAAEGAVERRIEALGGAWRSRTEDLTDLFERRLSAMARYASQLALIFRDHGGHHEEITRKIAQARAAVAGRLAERFWQPDLLGRGAALSQVEPARPV